MERRIQKRMIRKNSLLALGRTPGKTALFGVLILALTTVLAVCALLLYSCGLLLARRDQDYITTALIQGPGTAENASDLARTQWEDLDPEALAALSSVLQVQKAEDYQVWPLGYQRQIPPSERDISVLAVKLLEEDQERLCWRANVTEVLYSALAEKDLVIKLDLSALTEIGEGLGDAPEKQGDDLPLLQAGHTYLVTTSGYSRTEQGSGLPRHTVIWSDGYLSALVDITDREISEANPEQAPLIQFAEQWKRVKNAVTACAAADPTFLEEFTQGDYALTEGSLYHPGDTDCCLLPLELAGRLGVGVGDRVTLELLPGNYIYAQDGPPAQRTYTVSGLLSVTAEAAENHTPWIYLSGAAGLEDCQALAGNTLATLRLRNGCSQAELEELEAALPPGVTVTVFDQGWASVTRTLTALGSGALRLTGAALLASVSLLLLFAFLFVGKQAEALRTMSMLGTPGPLLFRYVGFGAGLLLGGTSLLACGTAAALSGVLNREVTKRLTDPSLNYSNASLGIVKTPAQAVLLSPAVLLVCWLFVTGLGLLFCYGFYRRSLRSPRERKLREPRALRPRNASMVRGPGRKYRWLSLLRGGGRSLGVAGVSLVLSLLLMAVGRGVAVNGQALADLTANTRISGYLTDFSGKARYGLFLPKSNLNALDRVEELENFSYAIADLAFNSALPQAPDYLVYTEDLLAWQEFDQRTDYDIVWLDGWEESAFRNNRDFSQGKRVLAESSGSKSYYYPQDPRSLWVVAPADFLRENALALGDTLTLSTREMSGYAAEYEDDYLIVGSLTRSGPAGGPVTLYTNLENSAKYVYFEVELNDIGAAFRELQVREGCQACRFELRDTALLQQAKDAMQRVGVSQVRQAGRYRIYPVFDDKAYLQEAGRLQNSITSYVWLLWIAGILIAGAGAALAWLLLSRRLAETAVLRSLGASRRQTFWIFWSEQALLCLGGTAAALLLWRIAAPWGAWSGLAAVFAVAYLLGTACSAGICLKKDLLTVLSEKEGET